MGDPILRKKSKEVTALTPRLKTLISDMVETMHAEDGVGLAAPQVGILKRICVVDTGEESYVLVNPVIVETQGEQEGQEGCLSVPGKYAIIKRPEHVKLRACDENMNERIVEGEGLLARALIHETEHLDGVLYVDYADKLYNNGEEPEGGEGGADDSDTEEIE